MSWEKMLMQFAMQALPGVLTRLGAGRAGEVFRELESDYRVWLETNAPVLRARGANIPDLSDLVAQDRAAVDARMREREEAETAPGAAVEAASKPPARRGKTGRSRAEE